MTKIQYIPPIKKESILQNLLIFDTESLLNEKTIKDDKKDVETKRIYHNCYMIISNLLIRNSNRDILSEDYKEFFHEDYSDPGSDFWNYIIETNEKHNQLYICSHNAKYDTLIIDTLSRLSDYHYIIEDLSFSNPFFIKAVSETDKKKFLFFFSTTNIFQTSIEKLGKELNLPKLEFDYFDKKPPFEVAVRYCRRDVEIISETLKKYLDFLKNENILQEKITIAGQAFSVFRQKYLKENTLRICHFKQVAKLERAAYHGGRTEVFRKGSYTDIYDIDKNSMYPGIMLNRKFPVEKILERQFLTIKQLKDYMKKYYVISYVYLKNVKLPIFAKEINGRLCFPTGDFFTALHKPEIEIALKLGYIDYIGFTIIYKEDFIFTEYIKEFYTKRQEAKKTGSIYALFYKYFLNSLYGKFGQYNIKIKKRGKVKDKSIIDEFFEISKDEDGNFIHNKIMVFNGYEWQISREGEAPYAMPAIAGAVTAYGRIEMFDCLQICGFDNIYYMDTDSIFTNKAGYYNMLNAGYISETEIGKFKVEEYCKTIKINNVKDYEFTTDKKTIRKLKGINLKSSKEIKPGVYEIDYWIGYGNIIHNRKSGYYTEKRIKTYKEEYNKGIVERSGTVKPFNLSEDFDEIEF